MERTPINVCEPSTPNSVTSNALNITMAILPSSSSSPEPSLGGLTLSGPPYIPPTNGQGHNSSDFKFPPYSSFPPFYTLQPNLTTRARQLELWSDLITSYCAHHRIFRLSLSSPPPDLFSRSNIKRSLKTADIRTVLEYMSQPDNGPRAEWIPSSSGAKTEQSSSCYVYWRTPADWADAIYHWIDETGQKGAVLTVYELREGEAVQNQDWRDIDEALLRKFLNILVKRGKAQIFGQQDNAGVKFF